MTSPEEIKSILYGGVEELQSIWQEIGLDESSIRERQHTVKDHFKGLIERMLNEEKGLKKKLLDSLESNLKTCHKLSKELGLEFEEPDSRLVLLKLEHATKQEATRLRELKEARLVEVSRLRRADEDLCQRLGVDPYYISSSGVPNEYQVEGLRDHIRSLEDEKFARLEQFIGMKEAVLRLFGELEQEPDTDLEREVACEDTDRFVLSSANLARVEEVVSRLEAGVKDNQRSALASIERIDALYERLQLDTGDKMEFLAMNRGHNPTILRTLQGEIDRLEEIKKANLEKFVITLRNELHSLWDDCFYSPEQRNQFQPLHSIEFTEELLDLHEAEVAKLQGYLDQHKDLFAKVAQRQEVWNKFMELERRSKDPSRLAARGYSMLKEEKERNKVNKALPRLEEELHELITQWEQQHGKQFQVGGVSFIEFIEQQKQEHNLQLEQERLAKERAKKETVLHETRFGAKPSTPAKLKRTLNNTRTPRKQPQQASTPGSARLVSKVSSVMSTLRSPLAAKAGRIGKGVSPRYGGSGQKKGKKIAAAMDRKLRKGILTESNYTLVQAGSDCVDKVEKGTADLSISSSVDYAGFKKGTKMNSTAMSSTPDRRLLTPQAAASTSRLFKTPTTASRSRMATPKSASASTSKLSTLRSGRALPYLI